MLHDGLRDEQRAVVQRQDDVLDNITPGLRRWLSRRARDFGRRALPGADHRVPGKGTVSRGLQRNGAVGDRYIRTFGKSPVPIRMGARAKPRGIAGKDRGGSSPSTRSVETGLVGGGASLPRTRLRGAEFPANREKNREYPRFRAFRADLTPRFVPHFRALTREFPAQRNREFFKAEQGIKSPEQGIWTAEQGTEKAGSPGPDSSASATDSMSPNREWAAILRRPPPSPALCSDLVAEPEPPGPEVQAIPKNWPVESRARGSYTGAYLLGGVWRAGALLLLRFVFAS